MSKGKRIAQGGFFPFIRILKKFEPPISGSASQRPVHTRLLGCNYIHLIILQMKNISI